MDTAKDVFSSIEYKNKQNTSYRFTLDELRKEVGDVEDDFAVLNSFTGNRKTKLSKIRAFLKKLYE